MLLQPLDEQKGLSGPVMDNASGSMRASFEKNTSLEESPPDRVPETEPSPSINELDPETGRVLLDDPNNFPEWRSKRSVLTIIGSFLGLAGNLAFVNSSGVTENYIKHHILTHCSTSELGWVFSVFSFFAFGGTLILGPVFDRVGVTIPLVFGTILLAIGFMCASVSTKLYQFILSYGLAAGIGSAFTFGPLVCVVSHYFLLKRGQAVGIVYISGGIMGIVFPIISNTLYPKVGFGWTVRIESFICLGLLTLSILLLKDRRAVFQDQSRLDGSQNIVKEILKSIDFTVFADRVYFTLVLGFFFNGFVFLITMTYLPSYGVAAGHTSTQSNYLMVIFNSFSILGRVVPGILADIYGGFNTLCSISALSTIAFCVIWLPSPIGHKLLGLYAFSAIYGFSSGSVLSLSPTCIGLVSKTKDFGRRSGTAFFILSFADLFGIPIGGAILGNSLGIGQFDKLVIFVCVCQFCGTVGTLVARYLYAGFHLVKA